MKTPPRSKVFDCRRRKGGWRKDLNVNQVAAFVGLHDVWPHDVIVFSSKHCVRLQFTGLGAWLEV